MWPKGKVLVMSLVTLASLILFGGCYSAKLGAPSQEISPGSTPTNASAFVKATRAPGAEGSASPPAPVDARPASEGTAESPRMAVSEASGDGPSSTATIENESSVTASTASEHPGSTVATGNGADAATLPAGESPKIGVTSERGRGDDPPAITEILETVEFLVPTMT